MELYFVRHAIAVERTDPRITSDAERWLTNDGIKKMEKAAKGLKKCVNLLDEIFTSPFVRAKQTTEIIARVYNNEPAITITTSLAPGVDFYSLSTMTRKHPPTARIAVVGHEPDISELIAQLVVGSIDAEIEMKKGAVCRVDIQGKPAKGAGLLVWLLQPKHLRAIA